MKQLSSPQACIPLLFEDRAVGVIVVYSLLAQKKRFVTVDRELFKLLGAHAGRRPRGRALLRACSGGRLPERSRRLRRRVCVGICRERPRQPITRKTISPR